MKLIHALMASALPPLCLAAGTGWSNAGSDKSDALACSIRSVESPGSLLLEAVVTAPRGAVGSYELLIAKRGGGGTSEVTQGGEFEVAPGEEVVVGEVTLGSGGDTAVEARLSVRSDRGSAACEEQFPGGL